MLGGKCNIPITPQVAAPLPPGQHGDSPWAPESTINAMQGTPGATDLQECPKVVPKGLQSASQDLSWCQPGRPKPSKTPKTLQFLKVFTMSHFCLWDHFWKHFGHLWIQIWLKWSPKQPIQAPLGLNFRLESLPLTHIFSTRDHLYAPGAKSDQNGTPKAPKIHPEHQKLV